MTHPQPLLGVGEPAVERWRVISVSELIPEPGLDKAGRRPQLLAMDGRSSSGKSTLAARLAASAGRRTAVVHTDDIAWFHARFDWCDLLIQVVEDRFKQLRVRLNTADRPEPLDLDFAVRHKFDFPSLRWGRDIDPQRLGPCVRQGVDERRGVHASKEREQASELVAVGHGHIISSMGAPQHGTFASFDRLQQDAAAANTCTARSAGDCWPLLDPLYRLDLSIETFWVSGHAEVIAFGVDLHCLDRQRKSPASSSEIRRELSRCDAGTAITFVPGPSQALSSVGAASRDGLLRGDFGRSR